MNIIQVKNLGKVYDNDGVRTDALRGVFFDIKKGEFVAIMGPSGSGKSTLLQILGLLDDYTSGSYLFLDKSIKTYNQKEIAKIRNEKMGFIFQSFNLLPKATVLENVKLPLLYSDKPENEWEKLAREAVIAVGLEHRMFHEAKMLSGGEKQRVAIARALVNGPEVIFADEPTGNLDSKSGQSVIEIIQKLNKELGHTVILITHETYTAEYAERIIRLHDGEIESDKQVENRRVEGKDFIK
ncbi:MAG: macrolide ABC transporter ATP-binding protein [Candidatus Taylorbacteria bacterium RIFOXYD2_FULL_36_9]|uniref:Macrolide ABC transporter ATP-binding protein n=1 Tax=Candidatus Taylorbacteria bacterium RIFOXYD2_FULL_36_9 TaxID=1802338 RepID=A0A1G2PGR5_9BACT|nr:MAG: macrolide ABC transporter ATP-binding protein [Candidatus Taylorbacteria bacterium RIFOXYD2_FULL_36_9]